MKSDSRDVFAFSLRGLSTMAPSGLSVVVTDSLSKKIDCHSGVEEKPCAQNAHFEPANEQPHFAA